MVEGKQLQIRGGTYRLNDQGAENIIQKGTETTHEQAKAKVQVSYMMRNLLMLVVGIVGVALPHFHWLAVLLPFVFPRIVIYLMQIFKIVDVNEPVSDVQNEPEGRENKTE